MSRTCLGSGSPLAGQHSGTLVFKSNLADRVPTSMRTHIRLRRSKYCRGLLRAGVGCARMAAPLSLKSTTLPGGAPATRFRRNAQERREVRTCAVSRDKRGARLACQAVAAEPGAAQLALPWLRCHARLICFLHLDVADLYLFTASFA